MYLFTFHEMSSTCKNNLNQTSWVTNYGFYNDAELHGQMFPASGAGMFPSADKHDKTLTPYL
jgi:hypothetical protein